MEVRVMKAVFDPGILAVTPGIIGAYTPDEVSERFLRHILGDWGDLPEEDKLANETALWGEGRLLSSYLMPDGGKLWIITEADRSVTTALLPNEY